MIKTRLLPLVPLRVCVRQCPLLGSLLLSSLKVFPPSLLFLIRMTRELVASQGIFWLQ